MATNGSKLVTLDILSYFKTKMDESVDNKIDNLKDNVPEDGDTLNELYEKIELLNDWKELEDTTSEEFISAATLDIPDGVADYMYQTISISSTDTSGIVAESAENLEIKKKSNKIKQAILKKNPALLKIKYSNEEYEYLCKTKTDYIYVQVIESIQSDCLQKLIRVFPTFNNDGSIKVIYCSLENYYYKKTLDSTLRKKLVDNIGEIVEIGSDASNPMIVPEVGIGLAKAQRPYMAGGDCILSFMYDNQNLVFSNPTSYLGEEEGFGSYFKYKEYELIYGIFGEGGKISAKFQKISSGSDMESITSDEIEDLFDTTETQN